MLERHIAAAAAGLIALAAGAPGNGQTPAAPDPATVRAEAEALIAKAGAGDIFINESDAAVGGAIILRHRQSGFRCVLNPGRPENQLHVFTSMGRGEDVGCTTRTITDVRTLFITKAPDRESAQLLAQAEREIQLGDPTARKAKPGQAPPGATPLPAGVAAPLSAHFQATRANYHVTVGRVDEWAVKHRFIGGFAPGFAPILDNFWRTTVAERARRLADGAPSLALPAPPSRAPPAAGTPEARAAARAEADAMIARLQAADLFENATTDSDPKVRHKASGLVCAFSLQEPDNQLAISPRVARGEDISCRTRTLGGMMIYYAVKQPFPLTLDRAFQLYMTDVTGAHPDAKPAKGPFADATASRPGGPPAIPRRTGRMTYREGGQEVFSRLSVALVGDWIIEQRFTGPIDKAMELDVGAELLMMMAVDQAAGRI